MPLTRDPNSVTSRTARAFGVTPEEFINWRWQMRRQISTKDEAAAVLNLASAEQEGFASLGHVFQSGITPYYMGLMTPGFEEGKAHCPIRLQALPRGEELADDKGVSDPLSEVPLSPVREVVHMYPDRVAFCVAQLCPVYCRYCFRKRRDDEQGLHFNRDIVARGIAYIASNPAIKDVLITGGDPFIASDKSLENLLQELRQIKHVEVIRFGTRTPVTLPYRVTRKLTQMIAKYHPVWVNTHFNCAEELTPEATIAIQNLVNEGIPVGNQAVLLKGVNDTTPRLTELLRGLVRMRVRPYYLFHPHLVAGTKHLRVPIETGLNLMKSLRGNLSGFAIPSYVLDTRSGKIPLTPNYILGRDGDDFIFENNRGEIWRESGLP